MSAIVELSVETFDKLLWKRLRKRRTKERNATTSGTISCFLPLSYNLVAVEQYGPTAVINLLNWMLLFDTSYSAIHLHRTVQSNGWRRAQKRAHHPIKSSHDFTLHKLGRFLHGESTDKKLDTVACRDLSTPSTHDRTGLVAQLLARALQSLNDSISHY